MVYKIFFETAALREFKKLPKDIQIQLADVLNDLESNPRPAGAVKLSGVPGYRIRKGNYRILYKINDSKKIVEIFRMGHRHDVYRAI